MPQPCRFCFATAHESICLDCKSKFDALKRENEWLKKQVAVYRSQADARYRKTKARIARKMRAK